MGHSEPTSLNQKATVFEAFPENGWGTSMGIWGGRDGASNVTIRLAAWVVSGSSPDERLGYTGSFSITGSMTTAAGGASYTSAIKETTQTYSPLKTAIKLKKGKQYALGYLSTVAALNHARGSGAQSLYKRSVSAQPPTDPFAATQNDPDGQVGVWIEYTPNSPPSPPTLTAPASTVSSLLPTFTALFVDADTTYGDSLSRYKIQLQQVGTTTLLWNQTYTASNTQQTNGTFSIPYGGSTPLVAGTSYEWRALMYDSHGEPGAYSAWTTFTITSGGTVTIPTGSAPTGKVFVNTGLTFNAKWAHNSGLNMVEAQVVLKRDGETIYTGNVTGYNVAPSTAPGTAFTVTWAALAFGDIAYGQAYTWKVRGKDSAGVWSQFATSVPFTTNAYPNAPTNLKPSDLVAISSPPVLLFDMTDPDDTPTVLGGSLTASGRILSVPFLANPDFLADLGGWTASNSGDTVGATVVWSRDTAIVTLGSYRGQITASTAAAGIVYHATNTSAWLPCVAGQSYSVQADIQTSDVQVIPLLQIRWFDAARVALSTNTEADWAPVVSTLTTHQFTALAPTNAVYYQVGLAVKTTFVNKLGSVYATRFRLFYGTRKSRAFVYSNTNIDWEYQTVLGTNDVQTISFGGTVTGGTWTFAKDGAVTTALQYNASAATVQTAIQALSTVGPGNAMVTGGPGPGTPLVVTFVSDLAGIFHNNCLVTNVSLTGTAPTVAIAHTTSGVVGDLANPTTYSFDGTGSDGSLTGTTSDPSSFIYTLGPVVTVTSITNGGVVTTNRPTIVWTASDQVSYRIKILNQTTREVAMDSGTLTSAIQSVAVYAGSLRNDQTYELQVYVTNSFGIVGTSSPIFFTVTHGAPAALPITATPTFINEEPDATAMLLGWPASEEPPSVFAYYLLFRKPTGAFEDEGVILRKIVHVNQDSFTDKLPASNVSYTYSLRQVKYASDGDEIDSEETTAEGIVAFPYVVLCDANEGISYRVLLQFVSERSVDHTADQEEILTWGNSKPLIIQSATDYQKVSGTFYLTGTSNRTAYDDLEAIRELWARKQTVCFRDERRRKLFGIISSFKESDTFMADHEVSMTVTETNYAEGDG